ncbi:hypothetical protein CEK62_17395 [Alcanivorax sp. N3-2A]|nr:hypothetical protein CEK62_17395 [Alcanivorax sp. N3-2A]|tara:strand:- start:26100 stop:26492 length:393 start_codon:yes stop_codon:yes gene_type:complete
MKRSTLLTLVVSAAAVVASPLAYSDNENIDSQEHIQKEYQKIQEQQKNAKENVDHENPNYSGERGNIDSPEHIKKEYKKDMERREEAKKNAMPSEDSNPNYSEDRRNIDDPDQIRKEYNKIQKGEGKPQE